MQHESGKSSDMAVNDEDVLRLSKPPSFTGKEEDWTEWSFVMRSYLMVQADEMASLLEAAEATAEPDVSMAAIERTLGGAGGQAAKKMFHMLVMTVKGPAQMVIRSVESQNGAEGW